MDGLPQVSTKEGRKGCEVGGARRENLVSKVPTDQPADRPALPREQKKKGRRTGPSDSTPQESMMCGYFFFAGFLAGFFAAAFFFVAISAHHLSYRTGPLGRAYLANKCRS